MNIISDMGDEELKKQSEKEKHKEAERSNKYDIPSESSTVQGLNSMLYS